MLQFHGYGVVLLAGQDSHHLPYGEVELPPLGVIQDGSKALHEVFHEKSTVLKAVHTTAYKHASMHVHTHNI